eukprot:8799981-Alexandrium_andersonii.AAC.1
MPPLQEQAGIGPPTLRQWAEAVQPLAATVRAWHERLGDELRLAVARPDARQPPRSRRPWSAGPQR